MLGEFKNIDRRMEEPQLEPVDVLMLTLDGEIYLEKCLDSLYREVPVNKLIVVDGGSKDKTVEILKQYPRAEIHVRPDIRTTGKCLEFIFSQASTPWVVFIDDDMELCNGWFDEMVKNKDRYDYLESKRIMHYEFYRENRASTDMNKRSYAIGQLARLDCFKNYRVDDDFMWGATDLLLKQVVEKNGFRYGKVATACHYHHTTDDWLFESDTDKKGRRLLFQDPTWEILNKENWERTQDNYRKAIVKYLDPESVFAGELEGILWHLRQLDLKWIKQTNAKWYNLLLKNKKKFSPNRLGRIIRRVIMLPIVLLPEIRKDFRNIASYAANYLLAP